MKKKTVYGELCPDDCDYCIEWCVDVELEDEQADDLLNLVFFCRLYRCEAFTSKRDIS